MNDWSDNIPYGSHYCEDKPDMSIAEIFEEIDRRKKEEKETREKQSYIDERQMNLFKGE